MIEGSLEWGVVVVDKVVSFLSHAFSFIQNAIGVIIITERGYCNSFYPFMIPPIDYVYSIHFKK